MEHPDEHNDSSGFTQRIFEKVIENANYKVPRPDRILRYGPATVVQWNDGSKTTVKRGKDDPEDPYVAFCAAFAIKAIGSNSALKNLISGITEIKKTEEEVAEDRAARFAKRSTDALDNFRTAVNETAQRLSEAFAELSDEEVDELSREDVIREIEDGKDAGISCPWIAAEQYAELKSAPTFSAGEHDLFDDRYNAYRKYADTPKGQKKDEAFQTWSQICDVMNDDQRSRYREWLKYATNRK